jgi:hypothetical protein
MAIAFSEIEPLLVAFARRQGLLFERQHEAGLCRLKFARKRGGVAAIVVAADMVQGRSFRVSALWWVDDYRTTMRRLKVAHIGEFPRHASSIAVLDMLQTALDTIDRWKPNDLDQIEGPFPLWHEKMTREQFDAITAALPKR